MKQLGDLREIRGELEIEWRIENFTSLLKKEGHEGYKSFPFYFAGASWYMKVYPKGINKKTTGWVYFDLVRASSGSPIYLEYMFGVKTSKGKKTMLSPHSARFNKKGSGYRDSEFLYLMFMKDKLIPYEILTITCTLKIERPNEVKISHHSRLLNVVNSFQELYFSERNADLVLNLQDDEKLRAHRLILEARSPIFSRDLKENQTSHIDVKDIDIHSMNAILLYMYTGDIPNLTTENVFPIYAAAQKYDVADVKQICLTSMQNEICDMIKFSFISLYLSLLLYIFLPFYSLHPLSFPLFVCGYFFFLKEFFNKF